MSSEEKQLSKPKRRWMSFCAGANFDNPSGGEVIDFAFK